MIAIYSQLLRRKFGGKLGPDGEEYIGHTIQGALRIERLLQDLRMYTQVSTADDEPVEEIDAGEVLKKTLANLDVAIKESGASISSTLSGRRAGAHRRGHGAARLGQVDAGRGADRRGPPGGPVGRGRGRRSVQPDHRWRDPGRPGADAGVRGRSLRVHPVDGHARACRRAGVDDGRGVRRARRSGLRPRPRRNRRDGPVRGRGRVLGRHDRRPRGARDRRRGPGDQGRPA